MTYMLTRLEFTLVMHIIQHGMTANHFAIDNEVIAIEPNEKILKDRFTEHDYTQIKGDMQELKNFEDES